MNKFSKQITASEFSINKQAHTIEVTKQTFAWIVFGGD